MKHKERSRFYHDLVMLTQTGHSVERALAHLKQGKEGPVLWMLDGLHDFIVKGNLLWEAMAQFPKYFDRFQLMVIKSAENSGKLDKTLRRLSRYYEMRLKEKRRFIFGMVYPVFLLHAVVLLPPIKYLIVSNLDKSYLQVVLPTILGSYAFLAVGYFVWKKLYKEGPLRLVMDEFFLTLPVLGQLIRDVSMSRVFWTLGNQLDSGMGVLVSAENAASTATNKAVLDRLTDSLYVLEGGRTFKEYFSVSGLLPIEYIGVVAVGEEAGALADSLEKLGKQMEEENNRRFTTLVKGAGYFAYLVAAAIAVMTVLSFYAGYFSAI
ncbi:MAG: hypothetical protein GY765_18790 [bacterium]|nr:hypothetical protein [bacterium]